MSSHGHRIRSSLVEDFTDPIPGEDLVETVPSSDRTAPGPIGSGLAEDRYKANPPFLSGLPTGRRRED